MWSNLARGASEKVTAALANNNSSSSDDNQNNNAWDDDDGEVFEEDEQQEVGEVNAEVDPSSSAARARDTAAGPGAAAAGGGGGAGGALLGRFARFLEHVTNPDEHGIGGGEEEEEEEEDADESGSGWHDDDVDYEEDLHLDLSGSLRDSQVPPPAPLVVGMPQTPPSSSSSQRRGRKVVRAAGTWNFEESHQQVLEPMHSSPDHGPDELDNPEGSITPLTTHRSTVMATAPYHHQHQGLGGQQPPGGAAAAAAVMVDHIPLLMAPRRLELHPPSSSSSAHSSLRALANTDDLTRDTGPPAIGGFDSAGGGDESIYDDENELEYGPVVDRIPSSVAAGASSAVAASASAKKKKKAASSSQALSGQNSLGVQPGTAVDDDLTGGLNAEEDDDDDNGWDLDVDDYMALHDSGLAMPHLTQPLTTTAATMVVVDHTPNEVLSDPASKSVSISSTPPRRHAASSSSSAGGDGGGGASMGVLVASEFSADGSLTAAVESVVNDDGGGVQRDGGGDDDKDLGGLGGMADDVDVDDDYPHQQFGPVVDHTPSVVLATGTASTAAGASVAVQVQEGALEQDYQDDDAMDETLYGDSTVGGGTITTTGGGLVGDDGLAADEMDGWDQDSDDLGGLDDDDTDTMAGGGADNETLETNESMNAIRASAASCGRLEGDHVVDHLPDEQQELLVRMSIKETDPSVMVLVAQDDMSRDTGDGVDEDVYDDENEENYGPVVDLTPTTPAASSNYAASQSMVSGANSTAVQAGELYDDLQQDDAMDDTAFGGDGDTTERDGWGQDEDDLQLDDDDDFDVAASKGPLRRNEDKQVAMVDHTPSEMGSPPLKVTDPSVDVLNSTSTRDGDSAAGNDYGPVVDHTPATPANSTAVRSDSVVVQVQDLDTVDESYADEDEEAEEDGGDTVNEEMPAQFRSQEAQLVDFIPNAAESRYGDASTMVAADFSEVLSEGDDMAPEEGNFGPVVDVTPPSRPVVATSGSPSAAESVAANSTAVIAPPSVAADDLDGDAEGDGDEETATRGDSTGWGLQETPNPQSGNEEPPDQDGEQLVDFLPPVNELEPADQESSLEGREPSSEVTLGGGQSLIQPLGQDPKEDDFGPVVDLTPMPRPSVLPHSGHSLASTATQVTASECRALDKEDITDGAATEDLEQGRVIVDNLPQSQVRFPADSTGSVLGSNLAEDEEEDEFGPVVDHLPTPRASLAPSRGGSTVDALATVSEVDTDDDDGGDAWDEDIDVSEGGISDRSALQKAVATSLAFRRSTDPERNVTVRFDIAAGDGRSDDQPSEGLSETHYFDPEMGSSHSEIDGRGSPEPTAEILSKAFAEADTPPSTPYRRSESVNDLPPSDFLLGEVPDCQSCRDATSIQCPCVRRLLEHNETRGSLIGAMMTPEGETLRVDFSKLLQDEMTRRMLVENESESLRAALEVHKLGSSLASTREAELETLISTLQNEKASLLQQVNQLESERESLDGERESLQDELNTSRQSLSDAEQKKSSWSSREAALMAQIAQLKNSLELATEQLVTDSDVATLLVALQSDLSAKSGECEELNSQIMQLQLRWQESEHQRSKHEQLAQKLTEQLSFQTSEYQRDMDLLSRELQDSKEQLANRTKSDNQAAQNFSAKVDALSSEKSYLLKSIEDLTRQHEEERQNQFSLLDKKNAEIRSLEAAVKTLQAEQPKLHAELSRHRSLAEQSEALAAELLSVAKERDLLQSSLTESKEAVASLQQLVDEHGMEHKAIECRRDAEIASLKTELANASAIARRKEAECSALMSERNRTESENNDLQQALKQLEDAHQSLLDEAARIRLQLDEEISMSRTAHEETDSLRSQVAHLTAEVERVEAERKKTLSHLATLGRKLERTEEEARSHAERASKLDVLVNSTQVELSDSIAQCEKISHERDNYAQRLRDAQINASRELDEARRAHQREAGRLQSEIKALMNREAGYAEQLTVNQQTLDGLASERDALARRISELEGSMAKLRDEDLNKSRQLSLRHDEAVAELNGRLQQLSDQLQEQRRISDAVTIERDDLFERCRQVDAHFKDAEEESSKRLEEMTRAYEARLAVLRSENDHLSRSATDFYAAQGDARRGLQEEMDRMRDEHAILAEENEELLVQLGLLKQQLDQYEEQTRILQEEVVARGDSAGRMRELSEENTTLLGEIERLKLAVRELASEKRALEETVRSPPPQPGVENEIQLAREQIQELQTQCEMQQTELSRLLSDAETTSGQQQEAEARLQQLEDAIRVRDRRISELQDKCKGLQGDLRSARDELQQGRTKIIVDDAHKATSFESAVQDLGEEERLHNEQRMRALQDELDRAGTAASHLEDRVRELQFERDWSSAQAKEAAETSAAAHNEEVKSLRQQLETVEAALHATRSRVAEAESERNRLRSELAEASRKSQSPLGAAPSPSISYAVAPSLEIESLRNHIVNLAVALERSETKRAEAITRLQSERELNARSLKRLSESVKRYYHTVSSSSASSSISNGDTR
jgi:chromosome segregation ATPase